MATTGFQSSNTVISALDDINEVALNIFKNTYVRMYLLQQIILQVVLAQLLLLRSQQVLVILNAFDINWGDGTTDTNVTDTIKSYIHIKCRLIHSKVTAKIQMVQEKVLVQLLQKQIS